MFLNSKIIYYFIQESNILRSSTTYWKKLIDNTINILKVQSDQNIIDIFIKLSF